jgi:hypothetical protein
LPYVERRIRELKQIEEIVASTEISIRGWNFPHTAREGALREQNGVRSESEFIHHLDWWRFFTSGQFITYRGMSDDWRDRSAGFWSAPAEWKPGRDMGWGDAVWQCVEVYEFAARLALSDAGSERMRVMLDVIGLEGRRLVQDGPGIMVWEYKAGTPAYSRRDDFSRDELVAGARDLGIGAARSLFELFRWDAPESLLREVLQRR